MIINFIENYAKLVVAVPEDVVVTKEQIDENFIEITISVNSVDIGKLIGKNGNMINALKTIANGCKARSRNATGTDEGSDRCRNQATDCPDDRQRSQRFGRKLRTKRKLL